MKRVPEITEGPDLASESPNVQSRNGTIIYTQIEELLYIVAERTSIFRQYANDGAFRTHSKLDAEMCKVNRKSVFMKS